MVDNFQEKGLGDFMHTNFGAQNHVTVDANGRVNSMRKQSLPFSQSTDE